MRATPRGAAALLAATAILAPPVMTRAAPPVFGPTLYERTTQAPTVVTETFEACRPERAFRLRVDNGPGGRPRVSSGLITLNGSEVVQDRDLHPYIARIERPVALRHWNTLRVRLAGQPGSALAISVVSETGCLEVALTSPSPNGTIPGHDLIVRGTVRGAPEVGVLVNGTPAAVEGDQFAALVAVDPSVTELIVVATAPDGATAEARQALTVTPGPESPVTFHATPAGGVVPVSVRFAVATLVPVDGLALDVEGDGVVDHEGLDLEGRLFVYNQPGLYFPSVTVVDADGERHSATAVVHVSDAAALDSLLQAKWTSMKDALRRGDIGGALQSIALADRDDYQELLAALTAAQLGQIDLVLADLSAGVFDGNRAEYEMLRLDNGVQTSYFVLFVRDADGIWRVKFF